MTSVVLNLLKNMDRKEMEISVLTALPAEQWFCQELQNMGIAFVRLSAKRVRQAPAYIRALSQYFKDHGVDVLHVHGNSATMWLEIYAAKKAGVPVRLAHSHSSRCLSKATHRLLQPLLIRDMTLGIGCSDVAREFAFRNKKSIVLNNGIDTGKFQFDEAVRSAYRAQFAVEDAFVVGHVGNLVPVKNHLFLCRVTTQLKNRGRQDIRFFFAGEGEKREEIESYLSKHNLSDMVTLLGSRADADKLYQMFDAFVLPSLYEGFPVVVVEARTAGLPCLISENVTRSAQVFGQVQHLPIDGDSAVTAWADAVEAVAAQKAADRTDGKAIVDAAGYSVRQCADTLTQIYMENDCQ